MMYTQSLIQDLDINAAERSGAGSRPRHYRHNHACLPAILHTHPSLKEYRSETVTSGFRCTAVAGIQGS